MTKSTSLYKIRLCLSYILMMLIVLITLLPALASISHILNLQGKVPFYIFTWALFTGLVVIVISTLSDSTKK
jgi:hypothetical protein